MEAATDMWKERNRQNILRKAWYAKYQETKITKLHDTIDEFLKQKTFEAILKMRAYQPSISKATHEYYATEDHS